MRVSVSEHQSLNSSKGIIRGRMLQGEKEEEIVDYLREQGVTPCKRFKIKKDHDTVETNTLLLTFNSINVPKSLKIFNCFVSVHIYVPNPLRCFNCQRFGHHENNCPVDLGSVCANCGVGGHKTPVEDQILEARPLINKERDQMIPSKWQINMASYMMT